MQQAFGLLRWMGLVSGLVLKPLMPGANRQNPVRAHLHAFVQGLQGLIVEGVFRALIPAGPDQRLMRIGQAFAPEIRHRIGFAPNDIIQKPEALILKLRAHTEDVVVRADHPDRPVGLQKPLGGGQPVAGETVVFRERGELIPVIIHRINAAVVRAMQIAFQLQVIRWVSEDQVH